MLLIEPLLSVIAPHECLGCGDEGVLLCAKCTEALPGAVSRCYKCQAVTDDFRTCESCKASPLRSVTVVAEYRGLAKDLIWKLKFDHARAAAQDIARLMKIPSQTDMLLVHMPTATSRVRQRGYDHARLIVRQLTRQHRMPHTVALARIGQQRQVGLSGAARRKQLQSAFWVRKPADVHGKHVMLIDDVLTTGASLEAAATVLKQAGAQRVDAAVFARA